MLRNFTFGLVLLSFTGLPGLSQDQSLAEIRADLSALNAQILGLRQMLSQRSESTTELTTSGPALSRLDQVEAEMRRLTGQVEQLEFRIEQIVKDGTNRIGDLEFRLVELEGGDVTSLGQSSTLGGDSAVQPAEPVQTTTQNVELAVAEEADFNAATDALKNGEYQLAADRFAQFTQTYPGGPLTGDALYWRGEALAAMGNWKEAARAYLASFSGSPNGTKAPDALHMLGVSLASLGQVSEACQMFSEVGIRYPGTAAIALAQSEMSRYSCS